MIIMKSTFKFRSVIARFLIATMLLSLFPLPAFSAPDATQETKILADESDDITVTARMPASEASATQVTADPASPEEESAIKGALTDWFDTQNADMEILESRVIDIALKDAADHIVTPDTDADITLAFDDAAKNAPSEGDPEAYFFVRRDENGFTDLSDDPDTVFSCEEQEPPSIVSFAAKESGPYVFIRAQQKEETSLSDLAAHLTEITTYKIDAFGNKYSSQTFQPGDKAAIELKYAYHSGDLSKGARLTYQLPEDIIVPKEETGSVYQGSTVVGTYTIGTEGKAEILLNPEFNTSEAFSGTLLFNSQISESASSAEHKVPLGDDVSITISTSVPERGTELKVEKTSSTSDVKNQTITYTVKVSSPTGTTDPVTVFDYPYETGLQITEITGISDNRITENAEPKSLKGTFSPLGKNESFSFSYTVHYVPTGGNDGSMRLENIAVAHADGAQAAGRCTVNLSDWIIRKAQKATGEFVRWTVYIQSPGLPAADFNPIFTDTLQDQDGKPLPLPKESLLRVSEKRYNASTGRTEFFPVTEGKIAISPSEWENGFSLKEKAQTLKEASQATGILKYELEYLSYYPKDAPDGSTLHYNNKANVQLGEATYSDEESYIYNAPEHKHYNLQKSYVGEKDGLLEWQSVIEKAGGTFDPAKILYTDTLSHEEGDAHFITGKLLKETLCITTGFRNNTMVELSSDAYEILNADGNPVSDSEKIEGFQIRFKEDLNGTALEQIKKAWYLSISYKTRYSANKESENHIYKNTAKIPGYESTAQFIDGLLKEASADNRTFQHNNAVTVDCDQAYIYYRIIVNVTNHNDELLIIHDTPPSGLEIDYTTARGAMLYENSDGTFSPCNGDNTFAAGSWDENRDEKKDSFYIDMQTTRFKNAHYAAITYRAKITDPALLEATGALEKTFTNTASFGEMTSRQTVTVQKKPRPLTKTGQQSLLESGNTNVDYRLVINPEGKDLLESGDELTLSDKMEIYDSEGINLQKDQEAFIAPGSIKLYAYDVKTQKAGAPINPDRYTVVYDQDAKTLKVTLPDEMACVLTYTYVVKDHLNRHKLKNSARLEGVTKGAITNDMQYQVSNSAATVSRAGLALFKVDASDYKKGLEGARFEIQKLVSCNYVSDPPEKDTSNAWWHADRGWYRVARWENIRPDKGSFQTPADGKLYFPFVPESPKDGELSAGSLYRIREVKAPEGYKRNEGQEWKYFSTEKNFRKAIRVSSGEVCFYDFEGTFKDKLSKGITYLEKDGSHAFYWPNEKLPAITVRKIWADYDNTDLSDIPDTEVHFTLYKKVPGKEMEAQARYTLKKENHWQKTLQLKDADPHAVYSVREDPVPGFKTVYSSNNAAGIKEGTLSITNRRDSMEVTVIKKWADADKKDHSQDKVNVTLYNSTGNKATFISKNGEEKTCSATLKSGKNWTRTWKRLPSDTYTVKEEAFPGYESHVESEFQTVQRTVENVNGIKETVSVTRQVLTITNTPVQKTSFRIKKIDSDSQKGLASAAFTLYRKDPEKGKKVPGLPDGRWKKVSSLESAQEGYTRDLSLSPGTYCLVETKAPKGHLSLTSPLLFTLQDGTLSPDTTGPSGNMVYAENASTLVVKNSRIYTLPQTGRFFGSWLYTILGSAILFLGADFVVRRKNS